MSGCTTPSSPRSDHQQSFSPAAGGEGAASTRPSRSAMYALAESIASISRTRVAFCRRRRLTSSVALLTYAAADGAPRAVFHGVLLCGSVWECPVCRLRLCAHHASEVERVVETHRTAHGDDAVLLLTLTVRHAHQHGLRALRQGVAEAWRLTAQGSWWARLDALLGLPLSRTRAGELRTAPKLGVIRALEVTHGAHGWHVHLHAVLLLGRALPDDERDALARRLHERWRARVVRALGPDHAPDRAHGVDLRPLRCHPDYLAKLGLRVADPSAPVAKHGNRTPLQIAHAYASKRHAADAALWQAYCTAMRGARMLTWTHGLRAHYGADETLDDAVATTPEGQHHHSLGVIPADLWHALGAIPHARAQVLDAAERGGAPEVERVIRRLLGPALAQRPVLVPPEE